MTILDDDRRALLGAAVEVVFPAMGTECHVVVDGPHHLLDYAQRRVEGLEQRWSRFRSDSELTRLNSAGGLPVSVSTETVGLVERMVHAWRATSGAFDPTVLDHLVALGYDRTFTEIVDGDDPVAATGPTRGCAGIEVDRTTGRVTLPSGVHLDAGGLGKGLAADLVASELMGFGATGVSVNLGGDLRVAGRPPVGETWGVGVSAPAGQVLVELHLLAGAVVTTTSTLRQWRRGGEIHHHLIDPRTGVSAATDLVQVSIVAGEAWWAEAVAKAAMLAGSNVAPAVVATHGASGLLVRHDGAILELDGLANFR